MSALLTDGYDELVSLLSRWFRLVTVLASTFDALLAR